LQSTSVSKLTVKIKLTTNLKNNMNHIDNYPNVGTKITITPNVGDQTDIFAYL